MTVLIVLALVVVALLVYAGTQADTFTVQRAATIAAPAERVFANLDDFHRWAAWSPWEKLDPAMERTFSGPEHGTGAVYGWSGNKKVGEGRMEILHSEPPSRLRIQLDFIRPFEAHSTTDFALAPAGDGTRVSWTMHGNHTLMSKVMCLFKNMDAMVGPDFERGLASLKAIAENEAAPQPA